MRHQNTIKKLGRDFQQRKALIKNLANSLILYEKIRTTEVKAKVLKPTLEKMVTKAKDNDLHVRRQLLEILPTKSAVNKMLEVLGPKYKDRKGGYLRITKIGAREGDGAKMAIIEFV